MSRTATNAGNSLFLRRKQIPSQFPRFHFLPSFMSEAMDDADVYLWVEGVYTIAGLVSKENFQDSLRCAVSDFSPEFHLTADYSINNSE